ncbi:copper chaperone PCu(A)C [Ensifer sp. MJa1]|uniref:copper chaperone PCu(A)C n=1 Tax=Ensifer sp. MJa1 TaxID=2919888 RepID=UPI00300B76E1
MTKTRIASLSLGLTLAASGIAHAHATFEKDTAPVETTFKAVLQVPHGCDGKPTTEVQVKLPEGFVFAKPQPKPGWELEVIKGDYQKTYDNHGKKVSSGPVEIRWKGGNLSDDYYDTFVVRGKLSGFDKETVLAFPTTQLCGTDGKVVWDQVAAEGQNAHDLKSPAPTVTVTMADAANPHAGHGGNGAAVEGAAKLGDLDISGGSVKAMLPGAKVGGGFLTIKNGGAAEDRLVAVESPAAARVEIHEMKMENDVMKMRKLDDGIALPAGKTVELKAGGLHLMFMDVKAPFKEGDAVPVTLTFEKAGKVDATFPVGSAKGGEAAAGQKHH